MEVITIDDALKLAEETAIRAVHETLRALGYKLSAKQWISQNQAAKVVGRRRLESAMKKGLVEWKKADMGNPRCPVFIRKADIEKLINNPVQEKALATRRRA